MSNLRVPYILETSKSFFTNLLTFFIPLYLLDIGMNGWQLGILMSLSTIASFVVTVPSGTLSDRMNERMIVCIGWVLFSVYFFGLTMYSSFAMLFVLFAIGGFGEKSAKTAFNAAVLKLTNKEKEGEKLGIFQSLSSGAAAIAFLTGGIVIDALGYKALFIICGIAMLCLSVGALKIPRTTNSKVSLSQYKGELLRKDVGIFSVVLFLFSLHFGAEATSYTPFLREVLNLTPSQMGLYIAIPVIALSIVAYVVGHRVDKDTSAKKALWCGFFLSGIGHLIMVVPIVWISFLGRLIHEIGDGFVLVLILIFTSKLFSTKKMGGTSSVLVMVSIIGSFCGTMLFGPIGYTYGFNYPLAISGAIILVGMVLGMVFGKQLPD